MKTIERNPIIFIPGIMGSMGDEIIPGTGRWGFGVAQLIYSPFIKGLQKIGYELGKDLFICYYDWRKSNVDSARKYLIPLIDQIKQRNISKKIDIICHSMGGIVARTYIQNYYYRKDIDKLIMIGTPNKGAISAYYFWSNGDFIGSKDKKRGVQQILSKGYLWLLQKMMNFSLGVDNLKKIHRMFPSVKELIPSYDYGPCMCFFKENELITVPTMYSKYKNNLLDRLNYWSYLLKYGTNNTYCIVGDGFETEQYLLLKQESFVNSKKEEITDIVYTNEGDGTVTSYSAQLDGISYYSLNKNHHQIVEASLSPIMGIYNIKDNITRDSFIEVDEYNHIHFLLEGNANIQIKNKKSNEVLLRIVSDTVYTKYEHIYERFEPKYRWLILKGIPKGEYIIEIKELDLEEVNVLVITDSLEKEYGTLISKNKTLEIQVF
ncbi:lipase family alpha/beta hydrolase [Serpentinicella alkaliphila]|uniref:Lecithin:cholesterol acyltransferase n=1 Tax=Serpentinicella alkaliphila TaxID=1734049 RepID=A0A4R2TG87_9FIRM|nr:alpha/beta hydrolase [Serpentinicella alkaliphila]QUH25981.1 alpha/beta hydrolase [Serpentinicella alkaliphila]TCQ02161.1 lecithin:cholesterol acyltransferase [Serpentinicella alkaliphila]